jgi:fatty-acyl-CoA synthase
MKSAGIGSWLAFRARLTPEAEAVVDGSRRLSYAELEGRVNRLSHGLLARGLTPGDRIAYLAHNRLEVIETILAAAKIGAVVVPLNWRLTPAELAFMVRDSGAETLLFGPEVASLAEGLLEIAPVERRLVYGPETALGAEPTEGLLDAHPSTPPELMTPPTLESPHIIMYTSGTTGTPKGAVLSQGASFWNALNLGLELGFTSSDRNLLVLPLFHIGGIGLFTLPMLYYGGTVVLQRTFDPERALELLQEERISLFFGVPAMFLALLGRRGFSPRAFASTRVVMSGGGPLPTTLIERYRQAGIVLRQGFGMSEAGPSIATLAEELAFEKAGAVGRPLAHVEARVVDEGMCDRSRGKVGELVIRGPNVMQGYWGRPEETEASFAGGWFHTGDLARMDADGDLFIVDRKKDMFISGGENVYPAEIENALFELTSVAEAAVVGVPDARWGEVGRAVIVVKPGMELRDEQILDHLKARVAKYKLPKYVVFVDALPRNAGGKVVKADLRGS